MITIKNYVRVKSLEEAWQLNQSRNNRILGGMMWLRLSGGNVNTAIDLSDLGLEGIEEHEDRFVIGAMTSLRSLECHEGLNAYCGGAVRDAVKDIVGVQFRNMATIGGSLWGRYGFSDVLTVLLCMDCEVVLYKGGVMPLEQFADSAKDNDILTHIIVKKTPGSVAYASVRNQRTDFPVIACAVSNIGGTYCVSLGARPAKAMLVRDEDGILSCGVTPEGAKVFADYAAKMAPTASNVRAGAEYRTHLIRVLTERCVRRLGGI